MEEVEIAPGDKSNPVKSFIAGGVGGMCNVLVGYPLDTIKVSYKLIGSSWISDSCNTYECMFPPLTRFAFKPCPPPFPDNPPATREL